jgi:hypothetical protein
MRVIPQGLKPRVLRGLLGSAEAEPLQSRFAGTLDGIGAANLCFEKDDLQAVRKDALLEGGFSRWGTGA